MSHRYGCQCCECAPMSAGVQDEQTYKPSRNEADEWRQNYMQLLNNTRLQIAAQMAAGMLACAIYPDEKSLARKSFIYADALIAEAGKEKG